MLAELLNVAKSNLEITAGQRTRTKKIMISGCDIQLIKKALDRILS